MRQLLALLSLTLIATHVATGPVAAQISNPDLPPDLPPSQCLAIASNETLPDGIVHFASATAPLVLAQSRRIAEPVRIEYITHSTYRIESPDGVTMATDYAGWGGSPTPTIVTMNKAHSSHWTPNPEPGVTHVLPGWGSSSLEPAEHRIVEGDVYVRNVTTDIRGFGGLEENANSIFIFETAGLCIAHLGHLHHALEPEHYAAIGRMDIIMIPVDGGLTLSHEAMAELVERLQPSILLPMHLRGRRIEDFAARISDSFAVDYLGTNAIEVSLETLPRRPTLMVPTGLN